MAANGGEDAIFYETTADRDGYYENKNWSETDVIEVLEGLSGDKNRDRSVMEYMVLKVTIYGYY